MAASHADKRAAADLSPIGEGRRLRRAELVRLMRAPTLGALRRQAAEVERQAETTWLQACEMATDLERRRVIEELDGILRFTAAGATPAAIAGRLRSLATALDGDPPPGRAATPVRRRTTQHMAAEAMRHTALTARHHQGMAR